MPTAGNVPFSLFIDEALCRHCQRCLAGEVCRGNAIRTLDADDGPFLDMSRCWGCLKCMTACPFGAVFKMSLATLTSPVVHLPRSR